ncbi:heme oxygenase [Leifsonia sp. EB41]|uniref:biliverdin-producing heme oxygenase n=1 Tax=Leifsonia sp. EB41 TaxID=3156260 RepID=UPI0035157C7D
MPEPIPFSQALRERTRVVHEKSEGAVFMQDLMAGRGSRDDYVRLLAQHWFVYDALEEAERCSPMTLSSPRSSLPS